MLNGDQLSEAIDQMVAHCRLQEENKNYEVVSARGVLNLLGYGADVEQVLAHIFAGGFTYCLDPDYHISNGDQPRRISADVCYWGPDQLRSRLTSLWWVL